MDCAADAVDAGYLVHELVTHRMATRPLQKRQEILAGGGIRQHDVRACGVELYLLERRVVTTVRNGYQ
jgi:hypothetical protein